jgi:hypothetical protein
MGLFLLLWFLSIRTYLYVIIRDIQYNCEGYMALVLVVQETFSSLLVVTLRGVRMTCRFGYRTTSSHMCIVGKECAIWKGVPISSCRVNLMTLTC